MKSHQTELPVSMVRPPVVAGRFYPADPGHLSADVQHFLANAHPPSGLRPKALIVPHAGYLYSGPVAATAYASLFPWAGQLTRVVLLGPTHYVPVRGLAVAGAEFFETPLGNVKLDSEATKIISALPQVVVSPEAHAEEHSLEVQLPFLQYVLPEFFLLPLVVGMASADEVADVLERVWGGQETLIIISSDLSHYLPYAIAQQVDRATVQAIERLQPSLTHKQACGGRPINGLLVVAQKRHMQPHLLDLRNSGDTAGSRDQVVGYAAIALTESHEHKEHVD